MGKEKKLGKDLIRSTPLTSIGAHITGVFRLEFFDRDLEGLYNRSGGTLGALTKEKRTTRRNRGRRSKEKEGDIGAIGPVDSGVLATEREK